MRVVRCTADPRVLGARGALVGGQAGGGVGQGLSVVVAAGGRDPLTLWQSRAVSMASRFLLLSRGYPGLSASPGARLDGTALLDPTYRY